MNRYIVGITLLSLPLLADDAAERRIEVRNEYNAELDAMMSIDVGKTVKSAVTGAIAASPCKQPHLIAATSACSAAISVVEDSYSHYESACELSNEYRSLEREMSENLQLLNSTPDYGYLR